MAVNTTPRTAGRTTYATPTRKNTAATAMNVQDSGWLA
jgi:hypothetical protein